MSPVATAMLLGEDHTTYGQFDSRVLAGGRTVCAISAGRQIPAESAAAKFDPNEDAVLAMDSGDAVLLAVADAHHGRQSSHELLRALARTLSPDVPNLHELAEALAGIDPTPPESATMSETTLLVVVYARGSRRGFGLSFGDSSALLVGTDPEPRRLVEKKGVFVTPARPEGLARDRGEAFRFVGAPGGLLVAFTDGIDECCYRDPRRSVRRSHLQALLDRHGPQADAYARALARQALIGVDGHPGGQDNLALAVAET